MRTNYTTSMVIDIFNNNYDAGVYCIECAECYKHRGSEECKNSTECIGFIREFKPKNSRWGITANWDLNSRWEMNSPPIGSYIPCCEEKYAISFSGKKELIGYDFLDVPLRWIEDGDEFFLTRKEAENALKERKKM